MDTEGRREAYDGFRVIKSCLQYVVNATIGSVEGIRLYLSLSVCLAVRQSSVSLAHSVYLIQLLFYEWRSVATQSFIPAASNVPQLTDELLRWHDRTCRYLFEV